MSNEKLDISALDKIIKNTVEVINSSKEEIFEIAEGARRECKRLEDDLEELKKTVKDTIDKVSDLEVELKESKRKLMLVSKNHDRYSESDVKKAYEHADNVRIELAVKREMEQHYIKQRNSLEIRIKQAYKSVERAENLINNVGVALNYLTGDLMNVTNQLEDLQQKQLFGIRIIKAQEDERKRVAREVHDGPAQSMSNVVMKAEICEKLIDIDIGKAKEELQGLKQIVRNSLRDVRKIIYDLRPMSLDDLGLLPTLQRYLETFQEETKINSYFRTRGNAVEFKPVISLAVFRIVQESLNNVKKYSKANSVGVNIEFMKDKFIVSINDDGKGFDMSKLKRDSNNINSGFGLMSMNERVELLDGEFHIDSKEGKGTWVKVIIPTLQNGEE